MISNLLLRIGGPSAVSLWAVATLAPIAILGSLFQFGPDATRDYFWLLLGAGCLSYLPSVLLYVLAYFTYLTPSSDRPSRPFAALATFALAGVIVGLSFSALVDSLELGVETRFPIGRALLSMFWSSLIALIMDAGRRYREHSVELMRSIEETTRLAGQQFKVVSELRSTLIEQLKTTILTAIEKTDAKGLNRLADDVIKPLRLELDKDLFPTSPPEMNKGRVRWWQLLSRALRQPTRKWQTALVAASAGLVGTANFLSLASVANFFAVFVLLWLNLALLQLIQIRSTGIRLAAMFVGSLTGAATGQALQVFEPLIAVSLGNLNLGSWLIAVFLGVQFTLERERRAKLLEMNTSLEKLTWQQQKLQQVVWVETRRLSKFVHSDIQGRIRAAAIRSEKLGPSQLDDLRSECLTALDRAIEPVELQEFLDQSARIWDGILRVHVDVSKDVVERLERDGFAKSALIEVIREGLCNAVSHGKADNAYLALDVAAGGDAQILKLSITNDGIALDEDSDNGFGSEIYDEASSYWSLFNSSKGVELVAHIALSAEGQQPQARLQ